MFPEVQGDFNGVSTPQNSFFIILFSSYLRTFREFKKINITASLTISLTVCITLSIVWTFSNIQIAII